MKKTLLIVFPMCLAGCGLAAEETSCASDNSHEPISLFHRESGDLPAGVPFSYEPSRFSDNESESTATSPGSRFGEANFSYPNRDRLSKPGLSSKIYIEYPISYSVIGIAPKQGPPTV